MNGVIYNAVVCTDLCGGIGKTKQGLLWHVPDELKHFKSITCNHPIVMGRKTYESIGKPLPDRQNIILTRDKDYQAEGCIIIHSPEEVELLKLIKPEVMIIGGLQIYKLFWDKLSTIYQSVVQFKEPQCDLFFPKINIDEWDLELAQFHSNFNTMIYTRK